MVDIRTGSVTPLPRPILQSLGETAEGGEPESLYVSSPDRSRLAYVGTDDGGIRQVFIGGIDGSAIRQVTLDPRGVTSPAWSPDGTSIAYVGRDSGGVQHLFVLDLTTREASQVTGNIGQVWDHPQFTPDGSSLVYTGGTTVAPELRIVPIVGGTSRLLIGLDEGLNDSGNGSLSPDGSFVTFLGGGSPTGKRHCAPCRLVAKSDGTDRWIVPGCSYSVAAGTWSPDGNRIVCQGGGVERRIIVVHMGTGLRTFVAVGSGATWLDNHTLIVEV